MSSVAPGEGDDQTTKSEFKVKGLPAGWRREVVVRKNGQSAGKTDVYYYSPCGKKFRSKPQIARFLGESADLTVFDFSRAGTPGDGSSRRRARDRSSRRAIDMAKPVMPTVRPLTNNPLRPSGPIRRTCGVIKLPVTWVPPPCDDEIMIASVRSQEAPPPPALNPIPAEGGGESTQNQPKPDPSPPAPPPPPPSAIVIVPALWENRLRGVKPYDYETGTEIIRENIQNGNPNSDSAPARVPGSEITDKSTLNALLSKQITQQLPKQDGKNLLPSVSAGNIVPSLLAHGKNLPILATVVPSLKTIKENGSLVGVSQQKNLAGNNNIVLTLPTMASASAFKTTKPSAVPPNATATQRQNPRARVGQGKTGSVRVGGPGQGKPGGTTAGGAAGGTTNSGLYVSETELRRQEEKVQLIRKQLMAAQSTV